MVCKEIWRWVGLRNEQPNGSGGPKPQLNNQEEIRRIESKIKMEVGWREKGTFHQPTLPEYAGSIILYTLSIYIYIYIYVMLHDVLRPLLINYF